jgi:signal peptidase I
MDNSQNQNQNPGSQTLRSVGAFIWDLIKILIIALVIIVPFRMFVAEPFVVSGSSMVPNFHNNDYLIVNKLPYDTGAPQRGDVVVLLYPKDTTQYFIKRIIGLPGESISFTPNGQVEIYNQQHPNGWVLNEPYLPQGTETYGSLQKIQLGSDEYYVLGDNRTASSDSRVWGILPKNDIVGKVWLRIFPFGNFGFVPSQSY